MTSYLEPIQWAFFIFPVIALFITMPYILYQYRKYGSVFSLRVVIVYSFLLYLLTSYFLVILPLPSIESVRSMTGSWVQLYPFAFFVDFMTESSFVWNQPSTYVSVVTESYFYQVFYNILLFVPFGIYLRYYFKCGKLRTIGFSFLLSLFFELTQLSGLYGIYPRPYRLFDVDDLMINTLGGFIGYLVTPFISCFLPSRDRLDEESYERGKKVSYFRRFVATSFDLVFSFFLYVLFHIFSFGLPTIVVVGVTIFVYFILFPMLYHDQTIGKKIVKIKLVVLDKRPSLYQYFVRYGGLFLFLVGIPYLLFKSLSYFLILSNIHPYLYLGYCGLLFLIIMIIYVVHPLISMIKHVPFWYESWSHVLNVSTVQLENEEGTE